MHTYHFCKASNHNNNTSIDDDDDHNTDSEEDIDILPTHKNSYSKCRSHCLLNLMDTLHGHHKQMFKNDHAVEYDFSTEKLTSHRFPVCGYLLPKVKFIYRHHIC